MSASPALGAFGFNNQPPASNAEYRRYMADVASGLVAEFGRDTVAGWRWGVFTEYNNADWLNASSSSFFELYDHTVCGLADELGSAADVDIGVHGCLQCTTPPSWDPGDFLRHAAVATSSCSPGSPVHLSWTGNSFYEHSPGAPGDLSTFHSEGLPLLVLSTRLGLNVSRFGIDEGRLLWGPDGNNNNASLTTRAVGTGYQASWDALFFKLLATSGSPGAYYSRWNVNAAPVDGQVPGATLFASEDDMVVTCAGNVASLANKLAGGRMISVTNTTSAASADGSMKATAVAAGSMVDAVVSVDINSAGTIDDNAAGSTMVVRALVFHHHPSFVVDDVPAVTTAVKLCGLPATATRGLLAGAAVTRVGNTAANFWPLWWADQHNANLSHAAGDYTEGWSAYSDQPPLASARARKLFRDGLARYRSAARLLPEDLAGGAIVGTDDCVTLCLDMPAHEVALIELPIHINGGAVASS